MSQFIYGQPQLETRAELINIDTVDLDGPAKIHEDFFRSLRILRAMVGYMVFVCIVSVPIMIFWGFFDGYITAINNFSLYVVVAIFFLGIFFVIVLHTFFYALRGVAVGSLGVTRSVVAITWVALAAQVYNWGFYIFEFTRPAPVVPFNIVVFISFHLIAVYVLYLLLVGLIKAIRSHDKIFYPWLHDQKYSRNFWPGWVGLIRSFWLAMGIPVPPRQVKMVRRITFAALCAFALEGLAVTSYFQISDNLDNRYEKLQEAGDRRGNTQYREYKWFFIDLLHEILYSL